MRTFIRFKSDKTGKQVSKEVFLDGSLPQPRVGDTIPVEGRPRQVNKRVFHLFGKEESGNWWSGSWLGGPDVEDDDVYVEISLIG